MTPAAVRSTALIARPFTFFRDEQVDFIVLRRLRVLAVYDVDLRFAFGCCGNGVPNAGHERIVKFVDRDADRRLSCRRSAGARASRRRSACVRPGFARRAAACNRCRQSSCDYHGYHFFCSSLKDLRFVLCLEWKCNACMIIICDFLRYSHAIFSCVYRNSHMLVSGDDTCTGHREIKKRQRHRPVSPVRNAVVSLSSFQFKRSLQPSYFTNGNSSF